MNESGFPVDESKISLSSATYVIGKETVNGVQTVRLDQRVEAKASMNYSEQGMNGTMSFTIQGTLYTNLVEGTGIVRQKSTLTMDMNATFSGNGEKMTMKMKMTLNGEYNLEIFIKNNSFEKKYQLNQKGLKSALMEESENDLVKKQIKIGLRLAEVIQKVAL